MKKITLIGLGIFSIMLLSFQKKKTKKIIFFGDSITLAGGQPGGYIVRMADSLKQKGITGYSFKAAGVGYDKVYDLYPLCG